jgi:prepilin-type N-terminal cleavage/methylation domain-containing protein
MSRRHRLRRNKGFSLVEVMVAMGVMTIGGLATLQLITILISSNQNVSSTTDATALANRLVSEISAARFISASEFDACLTPGVYTNALSATCASPTIATYGLFAPGVPTPVTAAQNPAYRVSYQVVNCLSCLNPIAGNTAATGTGGVEVVVEVDNFRNPTGSAASSGTSSGERRLLRPIRMVLRREYTAAADTASIR